jgi:hypothetical protein
MPSVDEEVIRRLEQDLERTVENTHAPLVADIVARMRHSDGASVQKLVDDVQQDVHDLFIDTTWPACPRHQRHPLWFRDGAWWCETDAVAVAKLGELAEPVTPRPPKET